MNRKKRIFAIVSAFIVAAAFAVGSAPSAAAAAARPLTTCLNPHWVLEATTTAYDTSPTNDIAEAVGKIFAEFGDSGYCGVAYGNFAYWEETSAACNFTFDGWYYLNSVLKVSEPYTFSVCGLSMQSFNTIHYSAPSGTLVEIAVDVQNHYENFVTWTA